MSNHRRRYGWPAKFNCLALALLCCLIATTSEAHAQVDEGAISGTVTDSTGAAVPNATVVLLNTDVGLSTQATTNGSGEYAFSPIRIGHYTLSVTASGFSKTTQENITVDVSAKLGVNVQLKTGASSETVEVTTAPPALQTDDSSVGQVVTEHTINALPLNGRNFTFLAQLGAGAQSAQADTRGNSASGAFSANGLRPAQNNYLLDGIDNNSNAVDFLNGTNFIVLPPVDAIQEFKVQTGNYSAELGRSAGAVLNATIKSGTNKIHGSVWEFFRNDKLDAADYFETKKGEYRQNQFGASIGGPILRDKLFFFGDYEGLRRVQGQPSQGTVPTASETSSGFTNLADIINAHTGSQTDVLNRTIPLGTILDPATTRQVLAGQVDPVSGITALQNGFARDPFGTCPASTPTFTLAACGLNQIPANRIDPVALKLLSLYPKANTPANPYVSNFNSSPSLYERRNAFDVRGDYEVSAKDQVFVRFSYVDDPDLIPGIFGGIADGGAFQQGTQTAKSSQSVLGYTHVFTPTVVNVLHVGLNHLHTTRFGPVGTQTGIPDQYGVQGIPQFPENGGLPAIAVGGLQTLGSNAFLPSDEISQTLQITDDFTKIYHSHNFKAGIESQQVKFSVLQPGFSRGNFDFNGQYTDISTTSKGGSGNNGGTGLAQFLLVPEAATVANGINYSGGADAVNASNVNRTYDYRTYLAGYFQDDWKITKHLTMNMGLRYDYFSPISELNGAQSNFVPGGPPNGTPTFLIPSNGKSDKGILDPTSPNHLSDSFKALAAADGIAIEQTGNYGLGLVKTQKNNLAPRFGINYQASSNLVLRAGFGLFYNSFENQGYGPNIGENYPFVFNFGFSPKAAPPAPGQPDPSSVSPISYKSPWAGCATAGPGPSATIGSGLSCVQLAPSAVNASGLGLEGLQFDYKTPLTMSSNASVQYAIRPSLTATVTYVFTKAQHLQAGIGNNNVTAILPVKTNLTSGLPGTLPFPDFGQNGSYQATVGNSNYHGLQTTVEQTLHNGLSFLFAYTYSKTLSDALDLLNGGSLGGFRAPAVPGLGPGFDYGPADFDIRHVLHLSGGYELPFGTGKRYLGSVGRTTNYLIGGWSTNYIVTLQGGQPITLGCPSGTTSGTGCNAIRVPGVDPKLGIEHRNGGVFWFNNPAAFSQPAPCTQLPCGVSALGGAQGTTVGPGFHRADVSLFKSFNFTERYRAEFRSEFFNVVNHPNFNAPGFGGNGVTSIGGSTNFTDTTHFGQIGSTRDAPNDPRQIQFALKLYF